MRSKNTLTVLFLIAFMTLTVLAARQSHRSEQIVTLEIIAPGGQKATVKTIVGDETPVTLTNEHGTWTISATGVEAKQLR